MSALRAIPLRQLQALQAVTQPITGQPRPEPTNGDGSGDEESLAAVYQRIIVANYKATLEEVEDPVAAAIITATVAAVTLDAFHGQQSGG